MRAAILEPGSSRLRVDEVDIAEPRAGQVRVRVHHCGVCRSDARMIARGQVRGPTILGHEAAGVIESIGAGVRGLTEGDGVINLTYRALPQVLLR